MAAGSGKKKKNGIKESFAKLTGKGEQKDSPGREAEKNRAVGAQIAAELRAVDFARGQIEDTKTDETQPVGDMQIWRDYMVKQIQESPTIFDQIAGIDGHLLYAAQALRTAVADGSPNKAAWARNALSAGILYLRDNVPTDQEERKEEILKERQKYLKKYKNIIMHYEKIDNFQKEIEQMERDIQEKTEEYTPIKEEVLHLLDTKEGKILYGHITAHQNRPDELSQEEKELMNRLRLGASLGHSLYLLRAMQNSKAMLKVAEMQRANDYRVDLVQKPVVYNEELVAEHGALLQEQTDRIARNYVEAAELIRITKEADARLKAIMNGREAQIVASNAVSWMESVLNEEQRDNETAFLAGHRRAEQIAKQKLANAQSAEQMNRAMEESRLEMENLDAQVEAMNNSVKALNAAKNKQMNMNFSC